MNSIRLVIAEECDIAHAARCARNLADAIGFDKVRSCYVATAASELAANVYFHAGGGLFSAHVTDAPRGIELAATDQGPGIADVQRAMLDGFSTSGSLGCGLPGVKRLMDEFEITTEIGRGTSVIARKWCER